MERKRVYDPVTPFPAPPSPFISFFAADIWTRMFIHDIYSMHVHSTYVSFLGTVRGGAPAYLAFSMNSGSVIIVASIFLNRTIYYYNLWKSYERSPLLRPY